MLAIYNHNLIDLKDHPINPLNRAFQYGDGIFETMIFTNRRLRNAPFHKLRLNAACQTFQLNKVDFDLILHVIPDLLEKEKMTEARLRLQVWRDASGLYLPDSNETHSLLTSQPFNPTLSQPIKIGISKFANNASPWSQYKTINCLPRVMMALERKETKFDDLLAFDNHGYISECISSNIFWINNDTLYTPSLACGCVGGTMRSAVIAQAQIEGIDIREGEFKLNDIDTAQVIFNTNAAGIRPISSILDIKPIETDLPNWVLSLGN